MINEIDMICPEAFTHKIMAKRHVCFAAVVSPINSMSTVVGFAPEDIELSLGSMPSEQRNELLDHLRSYTEKVLITEYQDRLWAFISTPYPSCSLCVALVFDSEQLSSAELLRLAMCDKCNGLFAMSKYICTSPSRMRPSLLADGEDFIDLCRNIRACFLDVGRLSRAENEDVAKNEIIAQVLRISELVGCPVDNLRESPSALSIYSKTDFSMLSAFLLTFMLYAKNTSPTRSVSIDICARSGAASVGISFESDQAFGMSDALLTWEELTSERNMYFEYVEESGKVRVGFHAFCYDWSYLGLKQNTEFV